MSRLVLRPFKEHSESAEEILGFSEGVFYTSQKHRVLLVPVPEQKEVSR
ncbi:MAG: hypothetical protein A4E23_01581 [Methanomethylovorans sp. PtaU1.Bin073]|nr:MAG: hypothetical protein A4E23_01581 [Methanomethylovorans sp. PtaU1.Bin073]